MARRMLIDASHPEETRVVVVDGTKLDEFDYETSSRRPLKSNIYLAKVIRIEPSLQAAFVEYGGNRHGFLAFSEIHPDYFQIPVADRERLLAEQRREAEHDEEPEHHSDRVDRTDIEDAREDRAEAEAIDDDDGFPEPVTAEDAPASVSAEAEPHDITAEAPSAPIELPPAIAAEAPGEPVPEAQPAAMPVERLDGPADEASVITTPVGDVLEAQAAEAPATEAHSTESHGSESAAAEAGDTASTGSSADPSEAPQPEVTVERVGGDEVVEERTRERRRRPPVRQYKIQEVIKRRQILLVQVVKEERGNKGAALTTYLSLAGRYCVLMPNAGRGGGISRKISNPADRKRMKEMLQQLEVPHGQGVILRTAGLERSNIDIKRDYEYLSRLWDSIRELTMRSTAPALIYEEGDLIKRSLRDVYDTDIAQVLVEGEAGHQAAAAFMRQLMPHEAGKVQLYDEPIPLFHRYQVESQFDAMHSPTVQLRSGGYIVINPTEALVAIDVNSGRSTKERNIEETAVRTNVEAAEEVARQVRLRDLAGLIVVDFIDMEENRHQRQVEHKMKDAMRNDRARIQIGRISAFGLLEMSRQRLRPSLLEHSTEVCPHCTGSGRIRSIESAALHALRAIEEEGVRRRASEIAVSLPPNVALYLLNHKREALTEIEKRYGFTVTIEADEELNAADCEIERVRSRRGDDPRPALETARASYEAEGGAANDDTGERGRETVREGEPGESERLGGDRMSGERAEGEEDAGGRRRRRRRRRGGRRDGEDRPEGGERMQASENGADRSADDAPRDSSEGDSAEADSGEHSGQREANGDANGDATGEAGGERGDNRRRRGRRGGRRRRREDGDAPRSDHNGDQQGDQPGSHQGEHAEHADHANGASAPSERAMNGGATPETSHETSPETSHGSSHRSSHDAPMSDAPVMMAEPKAIEPAYAPPPIVVAPPPEPVVAQAPQPVPVEPPPAPIVPSISADTPPEKPKRGWWRR